MDDARQIIIIIITLLYYGQSLRIQVDAVVGEVVIPRHTSVWTIRFRLDTKRRGRASESRSVETGLRLEGFKLTPKL